MTKRDPSGGLAAATASVVPRHTRDSTLHHVDASSTTKTSAGSSSSSSSSSSLSTIRPFPTAKLPLEILHNILDHVLDATPFGNNGRWDGGSTQVMSKAQWVRAHRQWSDVHLKFSLIHPEWTPHVLRHLYAYPRLTSKFSIQRFHDCLSRPECRWGAGLQLAEGHPSKRVGERRELVRYLSFNVGVGRHSSTDYIMYSGEWIAKWGVEAIHMCSKLQGWEAESWCSQGCDELYEGWQNDFDFPPTDIRRISLLRSTVRAHVMSYILRSYRRLETLELIDLGAHLVGRDGQQRVHRMLEQCPELVTLAIKVVGEFDAVGPLDYVFEYCASLQNLQCQIDLLSPGFFDRDPPASLKSVLFGLNSETPVLFQGRQAIQELWSLARSSRCLPTPGTYSSQKRKRKRDQVEEEHCSGSGNGNGESTSGGSAATISSTRTAEPPPPPPPAAVADHEHDQMHRLESVLYLAHREMEYATMFIDGEESGTGPPYVQAQRARRVEHLERGNAASQLQQQAVDTASGGDDTVEGSLAVAQSLRTSSPGTNVLLADVQQEMAMRQETQIKVSVLESWLLEMLQGPLKDFVSSEADTKRYIDGMCN